MTTQAQAQDSEAFHDLIHANNMYGLWELGSQMTPQPKPKMVPHMWPWSLMQSIVEKSGEVVPLGNERRALQLFNPGLGGRWATTNNLIAAVQVLLPGEVARSHRHTPIAIRFIMDGEGAYTAVDGERIDMRPGDLILTPSWAWHDHGNDGTQPVTWLDGLDIPLVASMEAMFFQSYEEAVYPHGRPDNETQRVYGQSQLTPSWVKEKSAASPLLIYSWERTRKALEELRDQPGDPFDGICLQYTNPQTGGSVLRTMACYIQLIRPGERLKAHRHTGSAVYHVVQGEGETVIDGQAFVWRKGDIIALAPWALHQHTNTSASEDAILFSIQDRPVLEALGLYREEAYAENDGYQSVTSVFSPTA